MSRFRVLQFNMQFGQVWDDADPDHAPINLAATMAEIKSHSADIIMLQEVERARPGGTHPPVPPNYSRLKQELVGYHSTFSFPRSDPRELPFGIGLAIFSRWPLQPTVCLNLPSPPVEFDFFGEKKTPTDRLLIGAQVQVDGHELRLMNTHLLAFFMLKSSSEEHRQQRDLVEEELRKSTVPTILTGDFNVSRHESLVDQFSDAGYRTVQSTAVTWRRRPYTLDHIFYNEPLRCVGHKVSPTPASDHHALEADFVFAD
ncbi:MAG: endonuclease/exonuclease/phosphatase family protein [Opitutaceae bacterium]|nr:endonuclease/exonuclease/phosphatase family protein [Opitutaceae bacterium]MBP9914215.1 endonuclease/exonuclease/phosphatase family protein [Opitutaceae bacterium]